jgi:hypothetical protein
LPVIEKKPDGRLIFKEPEEGGLAGRFFCESGLVHKGQDGMMGRSEK